MLGLKVITNIAQIVIQVVWNKEKIFVIKKVSQFGEVYKAFTKHHNNLFNNKHVKRPKYKVKKALNRYIINNGQNSQKIDNDMRKRVLIMIATTQITKGAALSKNKWIQSTKNKIWNDDRVLQERETQSDKNIQWERDVNDILANHAVSNDGSLDNNELVAFSSSF